MERRKLIMSRSSASNPRARLRDTNSILQLLASVTGLFLFSFAVDALVQRGVELFLADIVEHDTFFYSAVRQQDAFAKNIFEIIRQVSFIGIGVGFVATLVFFYLRPVSKTSFQSELKRLLKVTLLSIRGIATATFIFIVLTAIYELFLRIVGNQPPFFLIAALVIASMYVLILAYLLFDYARDLGKIYWAQ
jgi:hypothetical protein